jgi:hypothetical protein
MKVTDTISFRKGIWMKTRLFLRTLGLLAVFWASACAPAASPPPTGAPTQIPATVTRTAVPTVTFVPTQTPRPIATSRGPDLEASDPTMVRLDSGGLQLVEFFRFT